MIFFIDSSTFIRLLWINQDVLPSHFRRNKYTNKTGQLSGLLSIAYLSYRIFPYKMLFTIRHVSMNIERYTTRVKAPLSNR